MKSLEVMDKEDYQALPPSLREKYVFATIRDTVYDMEQGITMTELLSTLPFSRRSIEKHLEKLVAVNAIYARKLGNTNAYYPNGRAIHPSVDIEYLIGDKKIRIILLDNVFGKSVYIQELSEDTYGEEIKGGLLIREREFSSFLKILEEFNKKLGEIKGEN